MEKPVRIASGEVTTAPGREDKPPSAPGAPGFRGGPSPLPAVPALTVAGEEDRIERFARLGHAFQVMCSLVAVVWPGEMLARRGADAVSWAGAVLALHEDHDALAVTWRDEDHRDKFRHVADLAWSGLCESGWPVTHRNGDPDAAASPPEEVLW